MAASCALASSADSPYGPGAGCDALNAADILTNSAAASSGLYELKSCGASGVLVIPHPPELQARLLHLHTSGHSRWSMASPTGAPARQAIAPACGPTM